jgi:pimeloyl-ACP methyl ester carboxylesterase
MADAAAVDRGVMAALPYAALGTGRPLVVLAGLSPTTGVDGDRMVRIALGPARELARGRRVILFNRRAHLPRGMTMGELAAEHADAILGGLDAPVDVMGTSTGGSIAQQLAAEHPDVVDRLVLASTACRLGPTARRMQAAVAAHIRAGDNRAALAAMAAGLLPPWRGQTPAAAVAWLVGPAVLGGADLGDMATTIEAEDTFDLANLPRITAPTLILGGSDDRFYDRALFEETADLIPGSRLRLFDGRGHVTVMSDRRFRVELAAFLAPAGAGD